MSINKRLWSARKYYTSDVQYVDERYTTETFNCVWRIFKIGKYKGQEVKKICYQNPNYIDWCLKNWEGFKLTKMEHFDYIQGLTHRLERDPDNEELKQRLTIHEMKYKLRTSYKPQ
jgi:hypothetical protein